MTHSRLTGAAALIAAVLALHAAGPASAAASCGPDRVAVAETCKEVVQLADGIADLIVRSMESDDLKAAIVSVSVDGNPVVTRAWGESLAGHPATTEMHFRNGAIAIPYLTTLLLQLHDEGVLGLDDPLAKWLPQYPAADRVTLRMLGDNTAGYADYVRDIPIYEDVFRQWRPEELVAAALEKPVRCPPGECFSYSHANYVVLGEVLHKATGKPVEQLLRERILVPLGLEDTRSEDTAVIQQPVLHAFTAERGIYEDSTYWNPSWTLAQGAIMTTDIRDALASIVAIGSGRLVSAESHRRMLAPTTAGFAPMTAETYYALGVVVTNGWVMQTPSFGGYSAAVGYLPERRIGLAVTTTMGPSTPDERITNRLAVEIGTILAPDRPPRLPVR